jgi:hypothetical protein
MAAINFYVGLPRGALNERAEAVVSGTASAGTAVDLEIRMQIDNGVSGATGLTRKDAVVLAQMLTKYIQQGGFDFKGTNLPALSY